MDDIFLNIELLLCCCTFCETYHKPNNNKYNNYSNREELLTPVTTRTLVTSLRNEENSEKNQCIKRD